MSQPPLPPPIPQPVQVLQYNELSTSPGRPAAISVIGTLAIVFGAWGLISGFFGSLMAFGFMAASTAATSFSTVPTDYAGPNGHYVTEREVIVRAFQLKQPMTPSQQSQLSFLLSDVGTRIVSTLPSSSSVDPAQDYLNTQLTGESGTNVETGSGVWFDLPAGKVTVTDTDATFTPGVASSLKPIKRSTLRTMPNPANPSQLSTAEMQTVIDRVQEIAGSTPLTTAQVAALRKELTTNPSQFIGSPADMPALLGQITSVVPDASGVGKTVTFGTSTITLSANSVVTTTSFSANGRPFPKMRTWPLGVVLTGSLLGLLLSVYVLIVGIVTLRNSFLAPILLRVYAWLKIAITLAVSVAGWWTWSEFWQGIMAQGGTATATMRTNSLSISAATAVGTVLLGWAFPITILILLRTKTVKAFYTRSA